MDQGFPQMSSEAQAAEYRRGGLFGPRSRRAELVTAYPELDPVCDRLGFGHGPRLEEWSTAPQAVLLTLARAAQPPKPVPEQDWSMATIPELIGEIVTDHHRPLRPELGRLGILLDHLAAVHQLPELTALRDEFSRFKETLLVHLEQEEVEMFPLCIRLEDALHGHRPWDEEADVTTSVRFAGHGHAECENELQQTMELLAAAEAVVGDPDFSLVKTGLTALAQDLAMHTAKESELLIPAAIFAEDQLRARSRRSRTGSIRSAPGVDRRTGL